MASPKVSGSPLSTSPYKSWRPYRSLPAAGGGALQPQHLRPLPPWLPAPPYSARLSQHLSILCCCFQLFLIKK